MKDVHSRWCATRMNIFHRTFRPLGSPQMSCAMSKQVEFGEIDFEAIEYRNEYRYTNEFRHHTVFFNVAIFALPACVALWFLLMLLYGDALARLFGGFGL